MPCSRYRPRSWRRKVLLASIGRRVAQHRKVRPAAISSGDIPRRHERTIVVWIRHVLAGVEPGARRIGMRGRRCQEAHCGTRHQRRAKQHRFRGPCTCCSHRRLHDDTISSSTDNMTLTDYVPTRPDQIMARTHPTCIANFGEARSRPNKRLSKALSHPKHVWEACHGRQAVTHVAYEA